MTVLAFDHYRKTVSGKTFMRQTTMMLYGINHERPAITHKYLSWIKSTFLVKIRVNGYIFPCMLCSHMQHPSFCGVCFLLIHSRNGRMIYIDPFYSAGPSVSSQVLFQPVHRYPEISSHLFFRIDPR